MYSRCLLVVGSVGNDIKNDPRSSERKICKGVKKPEKKIRSSTGFKPETSRAIPVRCSMKPLCVLFAHQASSLIRLSMFPILTDDIISLEIKSNLTLPNSLQVLCRYLLRNQS